MKKIATAGIITTLIIGVLGVGCLYLIQPVSQSREQKKILIEQGDSIDIIAVDLYENGLIRHPMSMKIAAKLFFPSYSYKAGEYAIAPNESLFTIIRKLAIGSPRGELVIVIPEGWSLNDIGDYVENKKIFSKEVFLRAAKKDWSSEYPFLNHTSATINLEGYLFPDTYRIFADATPDNVLNKMLANFSAKVFEEYQNNATNKTMEFGDLMVLASIVEREVKSDADRAIVSDIFLRRMKLGMPLQADSTVNYITGKNNLQSTFSDIAIDSPYNTYRIKGLPPSPICNPGLSAIHAVQFPQKNDYLYFLSKKDGKTVFSRTFEEHVKNKRKYLKK